MPLKRVYVLFRLLLTGAIPFLLTACAHLPAPTGPVPGAERTELVLQKLEGKRVGLVVNQSSRVGRHHLIDMLQDEGVNVVRLFAVEHGIRGNKSAGAPVKSGVDGPSGLKVISLYGQNRAPRVTDVAGLDVMVFDLQDVGVRFYTYLSSLHYVMQSCARFHVPLIVLDRPNPNIMYVDGPVLEPQFRSFVGMEEVPLLHGMTLGELALMINGEGWLGDGLKCDLTVIPVKNYTRHTPYVLPVRPSPNLPNAQSVRLYPSLALFEATSISVGRGTDFPFQVLGGPHRGFGDFIFTPRSIPGTALHPKHEGETLYGTDYRKAGSSGLDIGLFLDWRERARDLGVPFLTRPAWLDKLMGTDRFRKQIQAGLDAEAIRRSWQKGLSDFKRRRKPYLLYPP